MAHLQVRVYEPITCRSVRSPPQRQGEPSAEVKIFSHSSRVTGTAFLNLRDQEEPQNTQKESHNESSVIALLTCAFKLMGSKSCLLYTSDAADE